MTRRNVWRRGITAASSILAVVAFAAAPAMASTDPSVPPINTVTPMPPILTAATYPGVPSATPMPNTPGIVGANGLSAPYYTGQTLKQCGSEAFIGGWFAQVTDGATGATVNRDSFFGFNSSTGALDPAVSLSFTGPTGDHTLVNAIECGSDGHSLFIGGKFIAVNGVAQKGVVKYDLTTHAVVTSFNASATAAGVQALLVLPNGDLAVGGSGGYGNKTTPKMYFASLNQSTGAATGYVNTILAGNDTYYNSFILKVQAFALSPTATPDPTGTGLGTVRHLLVSGVFTTVNGISRMQLAMLALTSTHPVLSAWDSDQFHVHCAHSEANTVRGVKYNLTGTQFATFSTGGSPNTGVCDAIAVYAQVVDKTKHNAIWHDHTGGDSFWDGDWASNSVVCGAGHERWAHNPLGRQSWGTGGVPSPGITCLNASNGSSIMEGTFRWNAMRTRNVGAQTVTRVGNSLWIISDGKQLGCANPGGGIDCAKDPSVNQSLVAGCLTSSFYQSCIGLVASNVNGVGRLQIG